MKRNTNRKVWKLKVKRKKAGKRFEDVNEENMPAEGEKAKPIKQARNLLGVENGMEWKKEIIVIEGKLEDEPVEEKKEIKEQNKVQKQIKKMDQQEREQKKKEEKEKKKIMRQEIKRRNQFEKLQKKELKRLKEQEIRERKSIEKQQKKENKYIEIQKKNESKKLQAKVKKERNDAKKKEPPKKSLVKFLSDVWHRIRKVTHSCFSSSEGSSLNFPVLKSDDHRHSEDEVTKFTQVEEKSPRLLHRLKYQKVLDELNGKLYTGSSLNFPVLKSDDHGHCEDEEKSPRSQHHLKYQKVLDELNGKLYVGSSSNFPVLKSDDHGHSEDEEKCPRSQHRLKYQKVLDELNCKLNTGSSLTFPVLNSDACNEDQITQHSQIEVVLDDNNLKTLSTYSCASSSAEKSARSLHCLKYRKVLEELNGKLSSDSSLNFPVLKSDDHGHSEDEITKFTQIKVATDGTYLQTLSTNPCASSTASPRSLHRLKFQKVLDELNGKLYTEKNPRILHRLKYRKVLEELNGKLYMMSFYKLH